MFALCFVNPVAIFNNNVNGTLNLLEALRILKMKPVIQFCGCHDKETKVLTNRGILSYDKIQKTDLILSINPNTNIVEFRPIKEIVEYDYVGPMHKFQNSQQDQLITPNHNILFEKNDGKIDFIRSELLGNNMKYYIPQGFPSIGCKDEKIIIGETSYNTKDIFYLCGLYIGDGYSSESIKKIVNKSGLNRNDYLSKCRSDKGTFTSNKNILKTKNYTKCHSNRIFLAIPEMDKARKLTVECLTRLGIKFKEYPNCLYFSSKSFVKFFDEFGHSANLKRIPEWVLQYDHSILKYLYRGLIDSDGYYKYKNIESFSTVSMELKDQMMILGILLGKNVSFSTRRIRKSKLKTGREIIGKYQSHELHFSTRKKYVSNKKLKVINYSGKVWCLKIENNHNFAVCRNGKLFFSGNTSEVYGQVRVEDTPIKETQKIDPINVYAISKLAQEKLCKSYWLSYGIPVIITRAFTYINPRRPDIFSSAFARQVVEVERGEREKIVHGNLDSTRTIVDVRDIMEAYWVASQKCEWGEEYNIGGTNTLTVGEFLKELIKHANISIETEVDPKLLRPVDVTMQIPDTTKFTRSTGWTPKRNLSDSIQFLLRSFSGIHG
jgi:nucleoside-diphosphate-sugar epimerase